MKKQKIYIIPTRVGLLFFLSIAIMLLVGASYVNNLINLLAFFLLSITLVSMVQTHNNLKNLKIAGCQFEPGFAGQTVALEVVLGNLSRDQRYSVDIRPRGLDLEADFSPSLPIQPGSPWRTRSTYYVDARGKYKISKVRISTVYPLGLFYAWSWIDVTADYYVYPKPEGTLPLPLAVGDTDQDRGTNIQGVGGDDFYGHRKFQAGDSQRHIDWKARARGRPLMVKEFIEGEPNAIHLDWYTLKLANSEQKLSQLTSWIEQAVKSRRPFALRLPGRVIPIGAGQHHYHHCLEALAIYEEHAHENS